MKSKPLHSGSIARAPHRGAAAVELAIIAPLFVTLVMGAIESGIAIDATHKMNGALREAGRLASMDYSEKLQSNQTGNQKVIQDVKNLLTAEGIPGSQVTLTITHADGNNAGSTFDLSDPVNDLALFRINATIPYSAVNSCNFVPHVTQNLTASIVFRKGKTTSLVN